MDRADLAARLAAIPVAEMSDTLAAAGLPGQVLARSLRPRAGGGRLAGRAVCLSGEPSPDPGLGIAATDAAIRPGAVVVVARGGDCPGALVGGNMISAWAQRGCAGLVVDGLIRDSADFPLPAYALGVTALNSRGRWRFTATDAPLVLPGQLGPVVVHPGDWMMGDADGALVIPAAALRPLIEDAEAVGRVERRMRAAILAGADRAQVYATEDRFAHVRRAGG